LLLAGERTKKMITDELLDEVRALDDVDK